VGNLPQLVSGIARENRRDPPLTPRRHASIFACQTGAFEYRGFAGVPPNRSDGLAEVCRRIAELGKVVDAYVARHTADPSGRFQPQREEAATVLKCVAGMPSGLMLESDVAGSAETSRQQVAN
jgi:hypothetical protein